MKITLSLPDEVVQQLVAISHEEDRTRSGMVARLIKLHYQFLAAEEHDGDEA